MRTTYRVLAHLVAIGVVVQAAAIAYAYFGLDAWIDQGGVLDKATLESQSAEFDGVLGFAVHGIAGEMVIPAIAVLLLISSFFARIPRGVLWSGIILLDVAVQVLLGEVSHSVPGLGMLHGLNALVLFSLAIIAGRRARLAAAVPATVGADVAA